MPRLDHVAIWTHQRDALLGALADVAGMAAIDGYSPDGLAVARGVRFANGPFLDIHQLPDSAPAGPARFLVALRAPVDDVSALAERHGWRVKVDRREDAARPQLQPPWSLVSFRRGQGMLSQLFAIEYHPGAATTADYALPLYDPAGPPTGAASLHCVWLRADEGIDAEAVLAALGRPSIALAVSPQTGLRLDLAIAGAAPRRLTPVDGVALVVNGG